MAKVYIGVGHGGKDPGAVANGLKESELALEVATACTNELKKYDIDVKQSRSSQTVGIIEINDKAKASDAFGADLCLDIHFNAGGGDGVEVWHSIVGGKGKVLAENIVDSFVKVGQNSRGVKTKKNAQGRDYFGMIRQPKAPAVIVECAFIDSADIQIADTRAEQQSIGVAIAKGVLKTLGISEVAAPTQNVQSKPAAVTSQPVPSTITKKLYLPASATSWRVYPTNKAPVKGNEKGLLNPAKFGGLSYDIIGNPQKDVYTIKTSNFGVVNIYAAESTGAVIK
jgi:N-acetylmuramoyl-L-alanine amidase